jgi:hypothetical protein
MQPAGARSGSSSFEWAHAGAPTRRLRLWTWASTRRTTESPGLPREPSGGRRWFGLRSQPPFSGPLSASRQRRQRRELERHRARGRDSGQPHRATHTVAQKVLGSSAPLANARADVQQGEVTGSHRACPFARRCLRSSDRAVGNVNPHRWPTRTKLGRPVRFEVARTQPEPRLLDGGYDRAPPMIGIMAVFLLIAIGWSAFQKLAAGPLLDWSTEKAGQVPFERCFSECSWMTWAQRLWVDPREH